VDLQHQQQTAQRQESQLLQVLQPPLLLQLLRQQHRSNRANKQAAKRINLQEQRLLLLGHCQWCKHVEPQAQQQQPTPQQQQRQLLQAQQQPLLLLQQPAGRMLRPLLLVLQAGLAMLLLRKGRQPVNKPLQLMLLLLKASQRVQQS
jgi:hypothetical protein